MTTSSAKLIELPKAQPANNQEEIGALPDKHEALRQLDEQVIHLTNPSGVIYRDTLQVEHVAVFKNELSADHHYKERGGAKGDKWVRKSTADEWIQWPKRSKVGGVTFAIDDRKIIDGKYNLWPGWPVEPVKGPVRPWVDWFDHVTKGMKAEHKKWLLQYLAWATQRTEKIRSAVLIIGLEGSGKTELGESVAMCFGIGEGQAGALIDAESLTADFNEWAYCTAFVVGDEIAQLGEQKYQANKIKTIITRQTVRINVKYKPKITLPAPIGYYFTANSDDAMYLTRTDRRIFVWKTRGGKVPLSLKKKYTAWKKDPRWSGYLLRHLQNVPLAGFDPFADAPETEDKKEVKALSRDEFEQWVDKLPDAPIHGDSGLSSLRAGNKFSAPKLNPLETAERLRAACFGKDKWPKWLTPEKVGSVMKAAGHKLLRDGQVKYKGLNTRLYAIEKNAAQEQMEEWLANMRG